jgi:hypothetical protein
MQAQVQTHRLRGWRWSTSDCVLHSGTDQPKAHSLVVTWAVTQGSSCARITTKSAVQSMCFPPVWELAACELWLQGVCWQQQDCLVRLGRHCSSSSGVGMTPRQGGAVLLLLHTLTVGPIGDVMGPKLWSTSPCSLQWTATCADRGVRRQVCCSRAQPP